MLYYCTFYRYLSTVYSMRKWPIEAGKLTKISVTLRETEIISTSNFYISARARPYCVWFIYNSFEAVLHCNAQRGGWFVVLSQIVCVNACQNVAQVLSGAIRTNGLKWKEWGNLSSPFSRAACLASSQVWPVLLIAGSMDGVLSRKNLSEEIFSTISHLDIKQD